MDDNKSEKLKEKTQKDALEYRLKRLFDILLEIDLKSLNELYQDGKDNLISK